MTDMVNLANTLLRGVAAAADGPESARRNATPTVVRIQGASAAPRSIESQINAAWDDLSLIALDARHSYDIEGLPLALKCLESAEREITRLRSLIQQAEANAPGAEREE